MKIDTSQMRRYIRAGLQLIPLHRYNHVDAKGKPRGKSPTDPLWQRAEYDSEAVLRRAEETGNNVGVRLPAEVMVLDVDPRNFAEGEDGLLDLMMDLGLSLSNVPHTVTGSGGHHYWYRKPADISVLDSLPDYPGIEFKSLGRQVVAAGAIHPCGATYQWDTAGPDLDEMPDLPPPLLRLIRRPVIAHGEGRGLGELTPERLADVLEQLDPEEYKDHDRWLNLMMACHHATAGEGRQEFIDWSTGDARYQDDGWLIGRRWDSLHTQTSDRPVTIRFLYKEVHEAGGFIPPSPAEEDFDIWEEVEDGDGIDDGKLRKEQVDLEGLPALIAEFNERHCVVFEGGRFRIFTEQQDPVLDRRFYARSTKSDFEDLYSNRKVEMPDGLRPAAKLWLNSGHRRQYEGVIFDPERDHEGWLNLWKGWAIEPKRGDWSLLKQLLLEVLVDGSTNHFEWVLNWLAYMVQHPGSPAEVAVCFKGNKGTGKGTLGRAAAYLSGAHGLHISSPGHLTGRFNSHLQNCITLFADEAFWAGDKAGESVLKQLVTEPTLVYEGKGRDAVTGRNLIHIIMASNNDWVVPAGLDGERRFAVFEVNDKRRGDKAFFKALNRQMYAQGGLSAMLFELLSRPLGDWSPRDEVPATAALAQQKLMTSDDFDKWWYDRLVQGFLPNQRSSWELGPTTVPAEFLRRDYMAFAKDLGVRYAHAADPTSFGMRLQKMAAVRRVQRKATEEEFGLAVDAKGRCTCYFIPVLSECRAAFEAKMGGKVEWPEE